VRYLSHGDDRRKKCHELLISHAESAAPKKKHVLARMYHLLLSWALAKNALKRRQLQCGMQPKQRKRNILPALQKCLSRIGSRYLRSRCMDMAMKTIKFFGRIAELAMRSLAEEDDLAVPNGSYLTSVGYFCFYIQI
jgi:hypothetical protein